MEIHVTATQLNGPIAFSLSGAIEVQNAVGPLEIALQSQLLSLPGELASQMSDGAAARGDVADFKGGLKLRVLYSTLPMKVKLRLTFQGAWGRRSRLVVEQQPPDIGQRQVTRVEIRRKALLGGIEPCLAFDLGAASHQT